jgi:hypothetical protein
VSPPYVFVPVSVSVPVPSFVKLPLAFAASDTPFSAMLVGPPPISVAVTVSSA